MKSIWTALLLAALTPPSCQFMQIFIDSPGVKARSPSIELRHETPKKPPPVEESQD